jgi:hypothetical protein
MPQIIQHLKPISNNSPFPTITSISTLEKTQFYCFFWCVVLKVYLVFVLFVCLRRADLNPAAMKTLCRLKAGKSNAEKHSKEACFRVFLFCFVCVLRRADLNPAAMKTLCRLKAGKSSAEKT